jgi:hypothetical protein
MRSSGNLEDYFTSVATRKTGSDFEDEFEVKVPSEGEVRIVANRNRQCILFEW